MPEEQKPLQGENANTDALNKGAGADDQNKQGDGGTPPEIKVPRRNAEYWEAAQRRRESQQARAEFFKSKRSEGENEEEEEDSPLTRREYKQLRDKDRIEWQEESDKKSISQADEISITSFFSKPENERFKKYEREARAYAKEHPYYPIEGIFRHLAYDDALAEGAKRGAKADEKSQRGSALGSERTGEPEVSGYTATDSKSHAEFKKKLRSGKVSFGSDSA